MKKASNYKIHVFASIIAFIITFFVLTFFNIKTNYIYLFSIIIVYGLLPDIDTHKSKIWKIIFTLLIIISILLWSYIFVLILLLCLLLTLIIKHRGFTHTFLSSIIFSLPLLYIGLDLFIGCIISYNLHLIIDGHIKFM
jgi:energy-converting hydrogenase Eha subunit A